MQIQKISSNNPNFGYNVAANKALIEMLDSQKKNKVAYQTIKELVTIANNTETELRKAERKKMVELPAFLSAVFLTTKITVTQMIETLFPDMEYRKQEIESYSEEIEQRNLKNTEPDNWLNSLTTALKEHQEADNIADMKATLYSVLNQMFPGSNFDVEGLSPLIKEYYGNQEEENVENEAQNSAAIGKDKVLHYEPKTEAEQKGFESLGGMQDIKELLRKEIIKPLKNPAEAKYNEKHYGIKMPNGILFYGPPGTGKTTIVERLSVEAGLPLLEITADSYTSKWVGETEENLGAVFNYAASIATEEKPVILFIDDVDLIVGKRNNETQDRDKKSMNIFFKRIQNATKDNIIIMAATNCYDNIDRAFVDRFRKQIYLGLPDKEARKSIIKMKLLETDNGQNLAKDEKALDRIADITDKYSIRALEDFVTETRTMAFENGIRDITLEDYETVIAKPESQNKKTKEENYKTKATRKSVGF